MIDIDVNSWHFKIIEWGFRTDRLTYRPNSIYEYVWAVSKVIFIEILGNIAALGWVLISLLFPALAILSIFNPPPNLWLMMLIWAVAIGNIAALKASFVMFPLWMQIFAEEIRESMLREATKEKTSIRYSDRK